MLSLDLIKDIKRFSQEIKFKNNVDYYFLNMNPAAIYYLEKHPEKIFGFALSSNPAALGLLKRNLDVADWRVLSSNSFSLSSEDPKEFFKQNLDKLYWDYFMANPSFVLDENYIDWTSLSRNPAAISILNKNQSKLDIANLCCNPAALHLLEKHLDEIPNFEWLSSNPAVTEDMFPSLIRYNKYTSWLGISTDPSALEQIENNLDKLSFMILSSNPAALHLLEDF